MIKKIQRDCMTCRRHRNCNDSKVTQYFNLMEDGQVSWDLPDNHIHLPKGRNIIIFQCSKIGAHGNNCPIDFYSPACSQCAVSNVSSSSSLTPARSRGISVFGLGGLVFSGLERNLGWLVGSVVLTCETTTRVSSSNRWTGWWETSGWQGWRQGNKILQFVVEGLRAAVVGAYRRGRSRCGSWRKGESITCLISHGGGGGNRCVHQRQRMSMVRK